MSEGSFGRRRSTEEKKLIRVITMGAMQLQIGKGEGDKKEETERVAVMEIGKIR